MRIYAIFKATNESKIPSLLFIRAKRNERYYEDIYGYKKSNLLVSHLLFLANLLDFSLLGVSQAASISSKLAQNFLRERCFAVLVSLFFTNARQKTKEC